MIIDPRENDLRANYKLLIGAILPRPIAFVSTVDKAGLPNLSPFSFYTGLIPDPPTICFAPLRRFSDGMEKDTLCNIRETGEFVINVVTGDIVGQANTSAMEFPADINEFAEVGLTPVDSIVVAPPRVLESPLNMECSLRQIVDLGPKTAGGGSLVIGEVLRFHIRDDLISDGRIDTTALDPIGRLAGAEYTALDRRFSLERER